MRSRVIYMGTPDFAVPALTRLASNSLCDLALVVTQPDRPAGRGKKMISPAVQIAADELDVACLQTSTLRNPEIRQKIVDLKPDLIIVAAFGMILGRWILELPMRGCVNLHASLLPKYRGANPIASAIAEGENVTGVSLMQMDQGLDTGPIYVTASVDIRPEDTTASLTPRLAEAASELLDDHLALLIGGGLVAEPQGTGATLTRMMTKADGWLDFSRSAEELERHVRAMWPWPRAWTMDLCERRIQIHEASAILEDVGSPGVVVKRGKDVIVGTGEGGLILHKAQMPGGKPLDKDGIAQSNAFLEGTQLGVDNGAEARTPLVVPFELQF